VPLGIVGGIEGVCAAALQQIMANKIDKLK